MRDDFPKGVKDVLAARVGNRCSMPTCWVPTSGPAQDPAASVKIGVAAHIAAASPGGPRYDETQTRLDRSSTLNGIWLCQTHAKLVDSDATAYPVSTLLAWKTKTEARIQQMLAAGVSLEVPSLELSLPKSSGTGSLLSFSNTDVPLTGRKKELAELEQFLASDVPLYWWAWTGPGGVGKSRLALELCRSATQKGWDAGFISNSQQSRLGGLQNLLPTLIVVDYAAERGPWLADALAQLNGRKGAMPVRVLVLERGATGAWWDDIEKHHRFSEGAALMSTMYGLARNLEGISREAARSVVRNTASQLGHDELSKGTVERVVDRALLIDPAARPLFVQVATFDVLGDLGHMPADAGEADKLGDSAPGDAAQGRDAVLRRVLRRSVARVHQRAEEPNTALAENVLVLTTLLGGISTPRYEHIAEAAPKHLLPSVYQRLGSLRIDDLAEGMKPDILGEMLVLDSLAADGVQGLASARLALMTFEADPDAFGAFAERAAADHPDHPGLLRLVRACESASDLERLLEVAVGTFIHAGHRNASVVVWTVRQVELLMAEAPTQSLRELLAIARFKAANLALASEPPKVALALFSEALGECEPQWLVKHNLLNNRGIAHLKLDDFDSAFADFTAVIESAHATDEARACALNNRADLKSDSHDPSGSIDDRTAVLDLDETTFNRRFIALVRRSTTFRGLGKASQADADIDQILATEDIAVEQKMYARLLRAQWLADGECADEAVRQIDAVLSSYRNFDDVELQARELRRRLTDA